MKISKLLSALVLGGAASFAQAGPTISNLDGTLTPFGGFDWVSSAAAWTSGYTGVVGSSFVLYYASDAGFVTSTSGLNLSTPRLDTTADGVANSFASTLIPGTASYEYTIFASLTEKIVSCNNTFTTCTFQVTGGGFDIYYDVGADALQSNGTGYLNGTRIIGGSVNAAGTGNSFDTSSGGQATLFGTVTYTNSTYVNPALTGSNLTSTLQLGSAVTNFTQPTGFDFNNDGVSDPLSNGRAGQVIIFQADANQTFTTVPEPSSVALAASGLLGAAFFARRRNKKS